MRTEEQWNKKFRDKLINQFTPRIQQDLRTLSEPKNLPEVIESCYLYAPTGYGKTLWACWLMLREQRRLYLESKNETCCFISVLNLLEEIKASFDNSEQRVIEKYSSVYLLVLDDIGVKKPTDWSIEVLYLIINNRYEGLKKTIITGNLSLDQLSETLGDSRIPSRIERMGKVIKKNKY